MLVDNIAQAYGWSFDHIMSLTGAQLLLINWGAAINHARSEERWERKRKREEAEQKSQEAEELKNPFIAEFGKRMDELNTQEQLAYFSMKQRQLQRELREDV